MIRNELAIPILMLASACLGAITLSGYHDWGGDFAAYVDANAFTVERSSWPIGPVAYPWGYPLLLSIPYALVGLDILAFKYVGLASFIAFLGTCYVLFRRRLPPPLCAVIVASFALNSWFLAANDQVLSDIVFLFFSTLALAVIDDGARPGWGARSVAIRDATVGSIALAAFLIRPQGLFLLAALLVVQLRRPRPARGGGDSSALAWVLGAALPYVLFGLGAVVATAIFPDGGISRLAYLGDTSWAGLASNLRYYLLAPASFYSGVRYTELVYLCLMPFFVIGLLRRGRRDLYLVVFCALNLAVCLVWPYRQGLRLLVPILPFYVYFVVVGVKAVHDALSERHRPLFARAAWAACIAVLALFLRSSVVYAVSSQRHAAERDGPFHAESIEMFHFVASQTPEDSVLVFFKPRTLRMATGRTAIMVDEPGGLAHGDFVIRHKERGGRAQLAQEELEAACRCARRFENERFVVYEIRRDDSTDAPETGY